MRPGRKRKSERKGQRDRQTDRWRQSLALHQINVITALIRQTLDRWGHGEKGWRRREVARQKAIFKKEEIAGERLGRKSPPLSSCPSAFLLALMSFLLVCNKGWFKKQPYLEEIPEVVWGGEGRGLIAHSQGSSAQTPHPHRESMDLNTSSSSLLPLLQPKRTQKLWLWD